jgi:hypothetical protein
MNPLQALENARAVMVDYFADLEIDRAQIGETSAPWIHYTRRTGSHLIALEPSDSAAWPAPGQNVKILFGAGDRYKILRGNLDTAQYFADQHPDDRPVLVQYWNGRTLRTVTVEEARDIVRKHHVSTETAWRHQDKQSGRA